MIDRTADAIPTAIDEFLISPGKTIGGDNPLRAEANPLDIARMIKRR